LFSKYPQPEDLDSTVRVGETLFTQNTLGNKIGCKTCHSVEADVVLIGPSMAGLGASGGTTVPGMTAQDYLRKSLIEPDAFIVEGYPAGVMPTGYYEALDEEQLTALADFLLVW
jgi:hypothetical protein